MVRKRYRAAVLIKTTIYTAWYDSLNQIMSVTTNREYHRLTNIKVLSNKKYLLKCTISVRLKALLSHTLVYTHSTSNLKCEYWDWTSIASKWFINTWRKTWINVGLINVLHNIQVVPLELHVKHVIQNTLSRSLKRLMIQQITKKDNC